MDSVRLRSVIVTNEVSENEKDTMDNDQESWQQLIPTNSSTFVTTTTSASGSSVPEASPTGPLPPSVTTSSGDVSVAGTPLRRSTRHHPPPDRYGFGNQLIVIILVSLLIPVLTTLCAHKNEVHTQFSFGDCHG